MTTAALIVPGLVPLHGLGGAKDLPIPASFAITGACVALTVSFVVLIAAWRTPRFDGPQASRQDRPVAEPVAAVLESRWFVGVVRGLGLLFTGYVTWALVAGPDLVKNPALGVFYVLLWVGIVPASLLFGPFYRSISPVRTVNLLLARATGGDPSKGLLTYPAKLGYWPAVLGLFAFVWQELVNPETAALGSVRVWLAFYVAAMLLGAAVYGDIWLARADPFEVYSTLIGKLSVWGRDRRGRLVTRSPLANLATVTPRPGLVAVVAVLLGSTAYDSYRETLTWVRFVSDTGVDPTLMGTIGLTLTCIAVGLTFSIATMSTRVDPSRPSVRAATGGGSVRTARSLRRALPGLLAHSVVPIVVGYMVAHYLSYLVEYGQETLIQLSDPMVTGANLLGTANWSVNYWLSFNPGTLATIKVAAVLGGHIVGVIAAHDRALTVLPKGHQVLGQLGLLVVMVAYTGAGLLLLFGV